jgi:hypothetical protein
VAGAMSLGLETMNFSGPYVRPANDAVILVDNMVKNFVSESSSINIYLT